MFKEPKYQKLVYEFAQLIQAPNVNTLSWAVEVCDLLYKLKEYNPELYERKMNNDR